MLELLWLCVCPVGNWNANCGYEEALHSNGEVLVLPAKVKLVGLGIISRVLASVGRILHRALDRLNSVWYRFSLYCLSQLDRWPNQTTGELIREKYTKMTMASILETWVVMDTCKILLVVLLVIFAVVPLGVIMFIVEIICRKRSKRQRDRVRSRRILNHVGLSVL